MANYAQGKYKPKNPHKYVGKHEPRYRSGWELTFMMFCDNNENVISWASEAIQIPYRNPLTGKQTVYVPDFFVMYEDKLGNKKAEIVEIKPKKQSLIESRVTSARDRAAVALNHAKWGAAMAYCKRAGLTFRVITEDDLFRQGKRK
jgi:hypothetical protein